MLTSNLRVNLRPQKVTSLDLFSQYGRTWERSWKFQRRSCFKAAPPAEVPCQPHNSVTIPTHRTVLFLQEIRFVVQRKKF